MPKNAPEIISVPLANYIAVRATRSSKPPHPTKEEVFPWFHIWEFFLDISIFLCTFAPLTNGNGTHVPKF